MRSLEKLWTIVYKIDQARQITPKGKPCRIPEETITGVLLLMNMTS